MAVYFFSGSVSQLPMDYFFYLLSNFWELVNSSASIFQVFKTFFFQAIGKWVITNLCNCSKGDIFLIQRLDCSKTVILRNFFFFLNGTFFLISLRHSTVAQNKWKFVWTNSIKIYNNQISYKISHSWKINSYAICFFFFASAVVLAKWIISTKILNLSKVRNSHFFNYRHCWKP